MFVNEVREVRRVKVQAPYDGKGEGKEPDCGTLRYAVDCGASFSFPFACASVSAKNMESWVKPSWHAETKSGVASGL